MFITDVASGGASDWALGAANVDYSYSMELRDTGRWNQLIDLYFCNSLLNLDMVSFFLQGS